MIFNKDRIEDRDHTLDFANIFGSMPYKIYWIYLYFLDNNEDKDTLEDEGLRPQDRTNIDKIYEAIRLVYGSPTDW